MIIHLFFLKGRTQYNGENSKEIQTRQTQTQTNKENSKIHISNEKQHTFALNKEGKCNPKEKTKAKLREFVFQTTKK